MNDTELARFLQGKCTLPNDIDCHHRLYRAVSIEILLEVSSLHVLLSNEVIPLQLTNFVDLYDIGLHEIGSSLGFSLKSLDVGNVFCKVRLQYFEGYVSPKRTLFSQINVRHSTTPQPPQQLVVTQLSPRQFDWL